MIQICNLLFTHCNCGSPLQDYKLPSQINQSQNFYVNLFWQSSGYDDQDILKNLDVKFAE